MLNGDSDTDFFYGNSGEDTLSSGGARDVLRGNMNNASTMTEADFIL